jgi:hypothetical protein
MLVMNTLQRPGEKHQLLLFMIVVLLIILPCSKIFADNTVINYNSYYRFPFSFGIEYMSMFPMQPFVNHYDFTIMDISGNFCLPFPFHPQLRLLFQAGTTLTFGRNTAYESDHNKYDHTDYYAGAGISYSHMFSKGIEAGADLLCGFSSSVFPYVNLDEGTSGTYNIFFETGATITINPIFNFSIEIHPALRYTHSLLEMDFFNGFLFSVGGSLNFRLGEDPDMSTLMRSIRFSRVTINTLFAAMQSYYRKNPIGEVTLINTEDHPITDIQISFYQAGYMDSSTPAGTIQELKPGENRIVPFFAAFNEEVFKTEGITPLTGEIIVAYKVNGKPAEQRKAVMYDLHDKTALVWDDDRKIAAFITPADGIIKNYASYIKLASKDVVLPAFNEPVQGAIQIFTGLGETGCLYQTDPLLPFEAVQGNSLLVDSVNLPRDTLNRISGDCDDLTVLFLSLLETQGVETGFITVPGHILPVFNTGIQARHYSKIHPNRSNIIFVEGEVWIPLEITLIGKSSFLDAWYAGVKRWQSWEHAPEKRHFYRTREAQSVFRSVGLKEEEKPVFSFGNSAILAEEFKNNLAELTGLIKKNFMLAAHQSGDKKDYNKLGIIYAEMNLFKEAEKAFSEALGIDPTYYLAKINLGNLSYQQGSYDDALSRYLDALTGLDKKEHGTSRMYTKLLLKISVVYYRLEQYNRAEQYFTDAYNNDPKEVEQYSYIVSKNRNENKGSDADLFAIAVNYLEDDE